MSCIVRSGYWNRDVNGIYKINNKKCIKKQEFIKYFNQNVYALKRACSFLLGFVPLQRCNRILRIFSSFCIPSIPSFNTELIFSITSSSFLIVVILSILFCVFWICSFTSVMFFLLSQRT